MASTAIDANSDDLYRALDGLTLQGAWHVRVASVVVDENYRWIQLDLVGPRRYSFLFRLTLSVDSMGVRHALQCWLAGEPPDPARARAAWDGIVAMHMVTEAYPAPPVRSSERKPALTRIVESAVEAVHGSGRAARRALGRM